ncbi:MAG: hypothetical protein WCE64_09760 [Bacteroidales bacterium]
MKNKFSCLLFLLAVFQLNGQSRFPVASEIRQFISSRTCIVLEDANPAYSSYIRQEAKECWNITPYEFISLPDFLAKRRDTTLSFIMLTETNFDRDKSGTRYNFINLLQGKNVDEIGDMPEICAIPLSDAGEDAMEFGYKLGLILSFIQNHARDLIKDPSAGGMHYLNYYNKNIPEIVNKTILVRQQDLSPALNTIDKIRAIYRNRIEIVPEEDIEKAVADKSPNTLILHMVGPEEGSMTGMCFKMLLGTDDSKMYYYNQQIVDKKNPDGLLPSDLKRLARF